MKHYRILLLSPKEKYLQPVACVWEGPASCAASALDQALGDSDMDHGSMFAVVLVPEAEIEIEVPTEIWGEVPAEMRRE